MFTDAKSSLTIFMISLKRKQGWEIFEGEIVIRSSTTSLLTICCTIILSSKVNGKSSTDPDDNF